MEIVHIAGNDEEQRVCEKLRICLPPFVGADGFTVLLGRALALAREDVPSLQTTRVTADGRIEATPADTGSFRGESSGFGGRAFD